MTTKITFPKQMPLISLKDTVVFPQSIISIYINEDQAQQAVQKASEGNKLIFLSCLQDPERDSKKVYKIGCVGFIMRMRNLNDGRIKILIQGLERASIDKFEKDNVYLNYFQDSKPKKLSEKDKDSLKEIKDSLKKLSQMKESFSYELLLVLGSVKDPGHFCDMLINSLDLGTKDLQKALEVIDVPERIELTKKIIKDELELSKIQGRLQKLIKKEVPRSLLPTSENFKPQQMNNYKKEEVRELKQKLEKKNLPPPAKKEALKHIARLEKMHTESSEASMVRNYMDWILDLPWNELSKDNLDLKNAQDILNEDHLGLKKVKERILEFLAVCHLKPKNLRGPILCFTGPPGVGKTSLGKSIARSLGRPYQRISLGGIKDEAEIRGHRRTYVGAMPGKIIQAIKASGKKNPVIVLDEIDKLCSDFRGDPSSALLEVLDPEQNHSFKDHYLNLEFDLSNVFFIATANLAHNILPPLKDRLEVIPISGYTSDEKKQIAKQHLISKELKNNGLPSNHIDFTEEALDTLIQSYTREAGLRNLRRQLASLCRKTAKQFVLGTKEKLVLTKKHIIEMLGSPAFFPEENLKEARVGIATGLAWTEAGGQILHIEALKIRGKGGLILTGKLGEVMKESAQAALSYVKSYAQSLNINLDEEWFDKNEIHIHVPGGAIPKDGPSAGVALASTLLSLITNVPLKNTVAMTGEVTLSGRVLPVGGIKEKTLAAFNNGIKTVILPKKNKKDLDDIPKKVKEEMNFILVSDLAETFKEILLIESLGKTAGLKEYLEDKELENVA